MTLLDAIPPAVVIPAPEPRAVTRAGRPRVRVVRPTDAAALVAFAHRCSPESLLHRFMSPVTDLPGAHLDDVLAGRGGMVSVVAVTDDGDIVGLATLAPSRYGPTELAVLVEDAWHRRGIGRGLVVTLAAHARREGISQVLAIVASERPWVLQALAPLGPFRHELDGPTIEAVFDLS